MERSPARPPSPLSLSDTSGFTYMDITYGPEKSLANTTQTTTNDNLPPSPSPATTSSFRIRRGHDWVDPGGPFRPPYTPAGALPTSHEAYSSWLHGHHATKLLPEGEMPAELPTSEMEGQIPQSQPDGSMTNDLTLHRPACPSAFEDLETAPAKPCRYPPHDDLRPHRRDFKPSWTPPWRRHPESENTRQPTFRVWEPNTPPTITSSPNEPSTGQWVTYPSILLTEPPPSADEERYRAQVAKGFRRTHGGRKCGPCIPRWMAIGIIVSLPVLLPVGMGMVALESGQEWWKGRRKEKARKVKVKANEKVRKDTEEEEIRRWKMDGWDDEDDEEDYRP